MASDTIFGIKLLVEKTISYSGCRPALKDISFRVAPLEKWDASEMMQEIKGHKILEAVLGMEAADLDMFSDIMKRQEKLTSIRSSYAGTNLWQ